MKKLFTLCALTLVGFVSADSASATVPSSASKLPYQSGLNGAIKVLPPQKDLETAIRTAGEGDILVYTTNGSWHHIDGKSLQQGTRVFVLGTGNLVSVFPKEIGSGESLR
jgi:hypothetical protein